MIRKAFFMITTVVLILAVWAGVSNALNAPAASTASATINNVRSYQASSQPAGISYAAADGKLYAGRPGEWRMVATPEGVIASSVALDPAHTGTLYLGAANEMAVYRSTDAGKNWLRVPLSDRFVGGVTSLAFDGANHLLFAGTDTAGIFRLRDVGSSMIAGGQMPLSEPVVQMAVDSTGASLAFARTANSLYKAENGGLNWSTVDNLGSFPTALAIVNSRPAVVYVGTADRGVLASKDGSTWTLSNDGLGMTPGSRLQVNALANDPAQLDVIYAATSFVYGSTEYHPSPVGVSMSTDGGASWTLLAADRHNVVAELLPVTGQTGAVYALTTTSRTPMAVGSAPVYTTAAIAPAAAATATQFPALSSSLLAWVIAGLAALAMLFAGISDFLRRGRKPAPAQQRPAAVVNRTVSQGR